LFAVASWAKCFGFGAGTVKFGAGTVKFGAGTVKFADGARFDQVFCSLKVVIHVYGTCSNMAVYTR
jgi:hypothetical protein